MAGCAPGGLAGHLRWEAKGFDATDHSLFRKAADLLDGVPEGKRIVGTLRDVHITFVKTTLGSVDSKFELGTVGRTNAESAFFGMVEYSTIQVDLYKLRRHVPEPKKPQVLAWVVYHELRHTEAKLKVGGGPGLAIDRNLDFYLYPSADQRERAYIEQAKVPFSADPNGKMRFPVSGN